MASDQDERDYRWLRHRLKNHNELTVIIIIIIIMIAAHLSFLFLL